MKSSLRRAGKLIARNWYRRKFKSCGRNFRWDPLSSFIVRPDQAEIGDNVYLGEGFHISVHDSLRIGDGVVAGPRLIIMGGDHEFEHIGKRFYEIKEGNNLPVAIEQDVWIGARVTILKGVTIGEGSVIGAGSIVTKDIPPYTIAVGSPAKPVKKRFSDEDLARHLELLGYDGNTAQQILAARDQGFSL